jgi:type VI secretion system protein ImpG
VTCSYTTAHEVNLLPLKIDKVELGGVPADLPLAQLGLSQRGIGSALRIRIACDGPQNLGHLDFDRLEFFLSGPDIEALKLLELVMEHHAGIVCQTVSPQPQRQLLASDALRQEGFEPTRRCFRTICATLTAIVCCRSISRFRPVSASSA